MRLDANNRAPAASAAGGDGAWSVARCGLRCHCVAFRPQAPLRAACVLHQHEGVRPRHIRSSGSGSSVAFAWNPTDISIIAPAVVAITAGGGLANLGPRTDIACACSGGGDGGDGGGGGGGAVHERGPDHPHFPNI